MSKWKALATYWAQDNASSTDSAGGGGGATTAKQAPLVRYVMEQVDHTHILPLPRTRTQAYKFLTTSSNKNMTFILWPLCLDFSGRQK